MNKMFAAFIIVLAIAFVVPTGSQGSQVTSNSVAIQLYFTVPETAAMQPVISPDNKFATVTVISSDTVR